MEHFAALGVHMIPGAAPTELIPDSSFIPDFTTWAALDADAAHLANPSTRAPLNNGNLSPGCQTYLDRKRELSVPNADAFRTVRRVPPPKGKSQARLGNSFEFYRHLDLFSSFWEDTSKPKTTVGPGRLRDAEDSTSHPDGSEDTVRGNDCTADLDTYKYYRSSSGHQMPAEYRQNITSAFLKLVAYDFGCNVSASRVEPRLYLTYNPAEPSSARRSSYFSSACTFVFRTPTTREAARAGVVEGPLAAVSARHTTSFSPLRPAPTAPTSSNTSVSISTATSSSNSGSADKDSAIDLARELIAALVTAQHRARQGRAEKRIGDGEWWTTKPRWGGGPGGPIGREVEMQSNADVVVGDKDDPPSPDMDVSSATRVSAPIRPSSRLMAPPPSSISGANKSSKRLKKSGNLPMYDNYRLVRPPAAAWDPKAKYEAIGRADEVEYDDIFVISTLFHHLSVLRVRVPDRLLAVLDGANDDTDGRSWGRLEVHRSPWYDLFKTADRVAAMELLWSVMAYLMRSGDEPKVQDAQMSNT